MSAARHIASLAKPKKSSILPVDKPLSLLTLQRISEALAAQNRSPSTSSETSSSRPESSSQRPAAILLPLFNINDKPAFLFQVRAPRMSTHGGEVSFPGGRFDEGDASLEDTAKRETYEEIGLPTHHIQLIGSFGPVERSLSGNPVHPFAGFLSSDPIHSEVPPQVSAETASKPLPNFDLSTLTVNPAEVALLFHLTLEELLDEKRLHRHHFRGRPPYWCVNVSDKVDERHWTTPRVLPFATEDNGDFIDRGKRLEIWGLTAWALVIEPWPSQNKKTRSSHENGIPLSPEYCGRYCSSSGELLMLSVALSLLFTDEKEGEMARMLRNANSELPGVSTVQPVTKTGR